MATLYGDMKTILVAFLSAALAPSPLLAGGLAESISREAHRAALQRHHTGSKLMASPVFVGGLAAAGAGGALALLSVTALKRELLECPDRPWLPGETVRVTLCAVSTTRNETLLWSGLGIAATGVTMMAWQGARHTLSVGPHHLQYRFTF